MGNSGNSSKKLEPTSHDKAELDLKNQRSKLREYKKRCALVAGQHRENARKMLGEGKKDQALLFLKKKRLQEENLKKTEGLLENLEQLINSLEFAKIQSDVFERLKEGNQMLTALNESMNIDDVEQLMEDTREAIAYQKEISEAISGKLTPQDDEAVEDEYQSILAGLQLLPDVPSHPLPVANPPTVQPVQSDPQPLLA
ncbi:MAG: Snf7 family protein [archaeon]|nr:Snf7 family protein [archaeon]